MQEKTHSMKNEALKCKLSAHTCTVSLYIPFQINYRDKWGNASRPGRDFTVKLRMYIPVELVEGLFK